MEEHQEINIIPVEQKPQTNKQEQKTKNNINRKTTKIFFKLLILCLLYGGYRFVSFLTTPHNAVQQIYLIPNDAIFIIQSQSPVADWNQFSKSEPWQCLKKSPSFAKIAQRAETLDSILRENSQLMALIGKRDLMISAHKVRSDIWDFLYVVDLQKISEINALKDQIETFYTFMDYIVTNRKFQGINITEMKNPETNEILYTAFVDNHYIASFTSKLVEASIQERSNPVIGLDQLYIEANKSVAGKGLFRMYVQYAYLPLLTDIYFGKNNEFTPLISRSLAYAGLSFYADNDKFELKGQTFLNDSVNPYIAALFHSGKREIQAFSVLSDRTAFYSHIGFDNPGKFLKELEYALSDENPVLYDSYKTSYQKIESIFGISLEDDFLSWMSGEFTFAEMEPGLLGHETEILLAIRTNNMQKSREKMDYIEKKIKRRTPISIKAAFYKGYPINYVEIKGFFSLFFGKMFDKFEKPYYTYIGNYLVLSNKPSTILSLIEDFEQKNTLKNDSGFMNVFSTIHKKSTYFIYIDTYKFLPLLKPVLNARSWKDMNANREIIYSFPNAAFQLNSNHKIVDMNVILNYKPYMEILIDSANENEEDTDKLESSDIDELNRFYAEKFQGNIYREFYPENALKSECEIREGKRHGKYHEYYEDGSLKIRGKYAKGQPKGTWKYYTNEGLLMKKIKLK